MPASGSDNSQVGVQVGGGALYVGSVSTVLGNDRIVPPGDDVRGELGDRCGSSGLKDVMDVNDVRLDLPHVWPNYRVREHMANEGVHMWFQNMITHRGNSAADQGVRTLAGVSADENQIHGKPHKL